MWLAPTPWAGLPKKVLLAMPCLGSSAMALCKTVGFAHDLLGFGIWSTVRLVASDMD